MLFRSKVLKRVLLALNEANEWSQVFILDALTTFTPKKAKQAEDIIETTIAFARDRETFGRPIAQHQVVAHRLADCATELEAARAFLYSVVWRIQAGEYPVAEISMVKKFVAQAQNRIADACLQIHGGAGYMQEYAVSRQFRDARLQRIGAGTDEVMNEVIAKRLGLGAPRG